MPIDSNRGFLAPPPDLASLHDYLEERGLARRSGGLLHLEGALPAVVAEHRAAAARVLALLERSGQASGESNRAESSFA